MPTGYCACDFCMFAAVMWAVDASVADSVKAGWLGSARRWSAAISGSLLACVCVGVLVCVF